MPALGQRFFWQSRVPTVQDMKRTGVYCWKNLVDGKVYIGSTSVSFHYRRKDHIADMRRRTHGNSYFMRAWHKYGAESFVFLIVEFCPRETCVTRETWWIAELNATDHSIGYNQRRIADSPLGTTRTIRHRHHLSKIKKNMEDTQEMIDGYKRGADARKGLVPSQETREKISSIRKQQLEPSEEREKMRKRSLDLKTADVLQKPEVRAKNIASLRSEKSRAKRSALLLGRPLSEEHRLAIKASRTPEFKKKMSQIAFGRARHDNGCYTRNGEEIANSVEAAVAEPPEDESEIIFGMAHSNLVPSMPQSPSRN
jgi:group I intron endonuclease